MDDDERVAPGGMRTVRRKRSVLRKYALVPLYSPQIPYDLKKKFNER
jgi:hypothetical protein